RHDVYLHALLPFCPDAAPWRTEDRSCVFWEISEHTRSQEMTMAGDAGAAPGNSPRPGPVRSSRTDAAAQLVRGSVRTSLPGAPCSVRAPGGAHFFLPAFAAYSKAARGVSACGMPMMSRREIRLVAHPAKIGRASCRGRATTQDDDID